MYQGVSNTKVLADEAMKKSKQKFPVLKGKSVYPVPSRNRPFLCPQCKKVKVMGKHPTAILSGGAMRVVDKKTDSAEIAEDCIGFLDLFLHDHDDGDVTVPIVDYASYWAQFDIYFCSTQCLRAFFDMCVDELETRLQRRSKRRRSR